MPGESPLSMMRPAAQRLRKAWRRRPPGADGGRSSRSQRSSLCWLSAWVWLWYYAASVADRTLAGWMDREAAEGRVYSCGSRSISGFPFRFQARCADAAAEIKSNQPPYAVKANGVVFAAEVYHPTSLIGDVAGPLTLAELGKPPSFVADWARARLSVSGRPPDPERVSVLLDAPHFDRVGGGSGNGEIMFKAKQVDLRGRIAAGTPRDHPVIEATLHLAAATAPTLHPLFAAADRR